MEKQTSENSTRWTLGECLISLTMLSKGISEEQIADTLGRSILAVKQQNWQICRNPESSVSRLIGRVDPALKRQAIAVYNSNRKRAWTEEEVISVLKKYADGMTHKENAARHGRTVDSVACVVRYCLSGLTKGQVHRPELEQMIATARGSQPEVFEAARIRWDRNANTQLGHRRALQELDQEKPPADDLMPIWISKSLVETLIKIGKACEELLESQEGK